MPDNSSVWKEQIMTVAAQAPQTTAAQPDEVDHVYEELLKFVGRPDGEPRRAVGVVSLDRIKDWCEAMGDDNPIYHDPAAARAAGHEDIVCPPAMLTLWTMAGLRNQGMAIVGPEGLRIRDMLREAGYSVVVAVNCEQEYVRYLRVGERLVLEGAVGPVSPRKQTALGAGYFHSLILTYKTETGEVVGRMTMRSLNFKPSERAPAQPVPAAKEDRRVPPMVNRDTAVFWEGAKEGKLLIQQCGECRKLRHPPEPMCPHCNSLDWHPHEASGAGTIHSYVVMHHPKLPGFQPPYAIGLVELDEGVRLVAGISAPLEQVAIGKRVTTSFLNFGEFSVPDFRLSGGETG